VTTRCDGCIAFHASEATKAGATVEELTEALGVAINLNAGAALVYSARTLDAFSKAWSKRTTCSGVPVAGSGTSGAIVDIDCSNARYQTVGSMAAPGLHSRRLNDQLIVNATGA
jgi:hypothetical protein